MVLQFLEQDWLKFLMSENLSSRLACLNFDNKALTCRFNLLKRDLVSGELRLDIILLALRFSLIRSRMCFGISIEWRQGLVITDFLVAIDNAFE